MSEQEKWLAANQRHLSAALDRVRGALLDHAGQEADPAASPATPPDFPFSQPPALDALSQNFNLSPFERDVVVLCAGVELDGAFAGLCARAQGDSLRAYPTFSLAMAALPEAHWSAVTPTAPLRRWRLVELGSGSNLMTSPLRIDERVLHFLTGTPHLDEQLLGFVEPVNPGATLVPSHQVLAGRIAALWARPFQPGAPPVVQLCSDGDRGNRSQDRYGQQVVAAAACATLGWRLYRLPAAVIPTTPNELDILLRLWEREAVLSGSALLLDCRDVNPADVAQTGAVNRFIEGVRSPLLVMGRQRQPDGLRPVITIDVAMPTTREQHDLWQQTLPQDGMTANGQVDRLTAQFNLNAPTIQAAYLEAAGRLDEDDGPADLTPLLWEACRVQARPQLDDLAQRIQALATWDELVLPEREKDILNDIAIHLRQRITVYEEWGFAQKSARGLGISALFTGPSGTGKTMAAEVLANELALDLYRIDLSQVVSKYIGETEKNLARVFDAAEAGGAILLFDEADALFGKRSEVKDSHDRYANIEIGYLLQRMEAYRGLAILTTNMKSALDEAFLRRIRFIVHFRFPDAEQREAIWRRIFPEDTPAEELDYEKLAQLNMAGGNIRNIAMNAAFYAADEGAPVSMDHILRAARAEYNKLEKTLTGTEIRGW